MSENLLTTSSTFMTASKKPITISSISMERAEQLMSQCDNKAEYDEIDDDELCRACDELENDLQTLQSQQNELNTIEQGETSTQNSNGGLKRKRLGVSTTPNQRRAIIRKH